MKSPLRGPLAAGIELYLAHKRSLGKQLTKPESMFYLLDRYLLGQGVSELRQLTPAHIDAFVASRPRHSPHSYNGARWSTAKVVRLDGGPRNFA